MLVNATFNNISVIS